MTQNPYVRTIGTVEDIDGRKVIVGIDHDAITVGNCARLTREQALEFVTLLFAACWDAAGNGRRMDEESAEDARPDCVACWHLWTLHSDDGCTAKVFPAGRCPCEHAGTEAGQ
jgi:hypothetical protein